MANIFANAFYEGSKKDPPFTSFAIPKLREMPWPVPMQSHVREDKYWRETVANKARDPAHQVSLHDWILYLLRFILTGDLRNAWEDFGGLYAQLSHLSIGLHLGLTGNSASAISYDWEIRSRLQPFSRRCDAAVDFAKFPIEENEGEKRYLKSDVGKGRPPQVLTRQNKKQKPAHPCQEAKKGEKG